TRGARRPGGLAVLVEPPLGVVRAAAGVPGAPGDDGGPVVAGRRVVGRGARVLGAVGCVGVRPPGRHPRRGPVLVPGARSAGARGREPLPGAVPGAARRAGPARAPRPEAGAETAAGGADLGLMDCGTSSIPLVSEGA